MATLTASTDANGGGRLSNAQTGNGASTNVVDRGKDRTAALLIITTTVGATPTVTVDIQGSVDNTSWRSIPYATVAAPGTPVTTALTITTATTSHYTLVTDQPWRYVRLNYSANTNVTLTADVLDASR